MKDIIDSIFGFVEPYKDELMVYGLALIPIIAGLSKFFVTGSWPEPVFTGILPISQSTIMHGIGAIELIAGLALLPRKRADIVAVIISLWLLAITAQVAYYNMWYVALRDFGLAIFALVTALNEYQVRKA